MDFHSDLMRGLAARGAIKDCSDAGGLDRLLADGARVSVYAGFDPTAGSLHVGHLATLSVLRSFAAHGHRAIAVIGTATALVGDPTGRSEARPLLDPADVDANAVGVESSIRRALTPFADAAKIRRNGEWLARAGWIGFLREVGRLVPVSRLLALESVRSRVDGGGMSFLELAYPLMQAADFLRLVREADGGPVVQVGGSDQWGNICAGLDLVARTGCDTPAFGMTHPLLTRSDGTKMGKTSGGAVWLNPDLLSDFDFFRFWRTLPDADAPAVARLVDAGIPDGREEDPESFKEALATEMTSRIRGEAAAASALAASRARGRSAEGLPVTDLAEGETDLAQALVLAGLAQSKGAGRRLAEGGGVRVNGTKRLSPVLEDADFVGGVAVLSAGRTRHAAVRRPA